MLIKCDILLHLFRTSCASRPCPWFLISALSLNVFLCLCQSLFLSLCLSLFSFSFFLSLSFTLSFSLSVCLSLSLSFSFSVYLSLSFSLSVSFYLSKKIPAVPSFCDKMLAAAAPSRRQHIYYIDYRFYLMIQVFIPSTQTLSGSEIHPRDWPLFVPGPQILKRRLKAGFKDFQFIQYLFWDWTFVWKSYFDGKLKKTWLCKFLDWKEKEQYAIQHVIFSWHTKSVLGCHYAINSYKHTFIYTFDFIAKYKWQYLSPLHYIFGFYHFYVVI
jgi:hypothetical protein